VHCGLASGVGRVVLYVVTGGSEERLTSSPEE
jgi:hypothetical protein